MNFSQSFLEETQHILQKIDDKNIENLVEKLLFIKKSQGRLFILGLGGSAANASHAVNDFRKITGIESYAPTDNVSELTARTNDEGFETIFEAYLKTSHLNHQDGLLIFSVGGGNEEKKISTNLISALNHAKQVGAKTFGIVGRDGGYTAKIADITLLIPIINHRHITPQTEALQSVIWHLIVSHPKLKRHQTKWESTDEKLPCYLS